MLNKSLSANSSNHKAKVGNDFLSEIKRCTRCIIPTSLPSVKVDKDGVCNYCRSYESLYGSPDDIKEDKKSQFEKMISDVKKLNRDYDCLVTLSGGKDSTYSLYLASKVYGLKSICITFDNGFLSDHAKENIKNATEIAGADHIFYSVNRNTMLKLYKFSLMKSGILCSSCMKGIDACGLIATKAFNPPLYFHGNSAKIGYVIYPELGAAGEIFRNLIKGEAIESEANQLVSGDRRKYMDAFNRLLFRNSYRVPRVVSFHDYFDVPREELYDTIRREMKWTAPAEETEHMDCLIHEIPFYIHKLKFPELTSKTAFLAGQVRFGGMAREEALEIENSELIENKKPKILDSFLKEIGMSENEFESNVRDWEKAGKFSDKTMGVARSIYHRLMRA